MGYQKDFKISLLFKTLLFSSFFLPEFCYANPVMIPLPSEIQMPFSVFEILGIDIIADFAVVVIMLLILKELKKIRADIFSVYMVLVVVGGLVMDAISLFLAEFFMPGKQDLFRTPNNGVITLFIIFSFVLIFIYNYFLSEKMLSIEPKKQYFLAIALAVCTNPVIYFAFFHSYR